MGKDETTEKDHGDKDTTAAAETDKKSRGDADESSDVDSSNELEAVRSKRGEPADNLRRRAEWFQKRSGGG